MRIVIVGGATATDNCPGTAVVADDAPSGNPSSAVKRARFAACSQRPFRILHREDHGGIPNGTLPFHRITAALVTLGGRRLPSVQLGAASVLSRRSIRGCPGEDSWQPLLELIIGREEIVQRTASELAGVWKYRIDVLYRFTHAINLEAVRHRR